MSGLSGPEEMMQMIMYERHCMLEEIQRLRTENKMLQGSVASLRRKVDDSSVAVEKLRADLEAEKKNVEVADAARELLDGELKECQRREQGLLSAAAKRPPERSTSPASASLPADLEAIIRSLPTALTELQRGARPSVGTCDEPYTLVVWDIENVGMPPSLRAIDVGNIMTQLNEQLVLLLSLPESGGLVDIVAAHNPRSRDGAADEFYIPAHVAATLTQCGVQLADIGNKKEAADKYLARFLNKWLVSTASYATRSVVFITGDGGFATAASDAKRAGCTTALIFCDHSVNRAALLPSFAAARRLKWDQIIGVEGARQLEERQRRQNEQRLRGTKQGHDYESYDPRYPGTNPRPELFKTALCEFHLAGDPCLWTERYGSCWFAHGARELRSVGIAMTREVL